MWQDQSCPVCGARDLVVVGPLRVVGPQMELQELSGVQCTLCGHLGIQIPLPWLVRLYPPGVDQITLARRERHRLRMQTRRRGPVGPSPLRPL